MKRIADVLPAKALMIEDVSAQVSIHLPISTTRTSSSHRNWLEAISTSGLRGIGVLARNLGSTAFYGWIREKLMVQDLLKNLCPSLYQLYQCVRLPDPDGQGEICIGHVVVSPFGLFVIETLHHDGRISCPSERQMWHWETRKETQLFVNPLGQNKVRIHALINYLGIPASRYHSAIVFVGDANLQSPVPEGVLTQDILPWITGHTATVLGPTALTLAHARLAQIQLTSRHLPEFRAVIAQ